MNECSGYFISSAVFGFVAALGLCLTIQYNILLLQWQTDRCESDIAY